MVAQVRKKLGIKKVGHAGTLDPLAEGVLIVLTEKDTKKQSEFMNLEKEYITELAFGIYSESYDLEFLPKVTGELSLETIKQNIDKVLKTFTGKLKQEVPMYSAVSVDGKRLYDLARKGKQVESVPVKYIDIYSIELLNVYEKQIKTESGEINVPVIKIKVRCSSGTYIRALARDIGKMFAVDAVMVSLVRTKIGNYFVNSSIKIDELKK